MQNKRKIVWLASYPKSGNTWFRLFLTALLHNTDLNINEIKTDGMFSSRAIFDECTGLDSTDFLEDEIKSMQPQIFNFLSSVHEHEKLYIKIHDAFAFNKNGHSIIPDESTHSVIYFIRNPLDIASSLAHHMNLNTDEAIRLINEEKAALAGQKTNAHTEKQLRQVLTDWSSHVNSWVNECPFPVKVLRYEDMLCDPISSFSDAVKFLGIPLDVDAIKNAIDKTSFERLQQQEKEHSFVEKTRPGAPFFRSGKMNSWKIELTSDQAGKIREKHAAVMKRFNY